MRVMVVMQAVFMFQAWLQRLFCNCVNQVGCTISHFNVCGLFSTRTCQPGLAVLRSHDCGLFYACACSTHGPVTGDSCMTFKLTLDNTWAPWIIHWALLNCLILHKTSHGVLHKHMPEQNHLEKIRRISSDLFALVGNCTIPIMNARGSKVYPCQLGQWPQWCIWVCSWWRSLWVKLTTTSWVHNSTLS